MNIRLQANETYPAKASVEDPDQDSLVFLWEILEESTDLKTGGDLEQKPPEVGGLIANPRDASISFTAPEKEGAYRLFFYAFDGKGHAAHANIPFYVEPKEGAQDVRPSE